MAKSRIMFWHSGIVEVWEGLMKLGISLCCVYVYMLEMEKNGSVRCVFQWTNMVRLSKKDIILLKKIE